MDPGISTTKSSETSSSADSNVAGSNRSKSRRTVAMLDSLIGFAHVTERLQQIGEPEPQLWVGQLTRGREALVGKPQRQLDVEHLRPRVAQHLAQLGLGPDRTEQTGAGAHHRDGLAAQYVVREWPGGPVDRVLEHAGNRRVVLGRGDQQGVG